MASEYCAGSVRAPAMECAQCHALVLDEAAATSEQERESVRMAVAARAAHCAAEPLHGLWPELHEGELPEGAEESDKPGVVQKS